MTSDYHFEIIGQNENTLRFRLKKSEHFLTFAEVFELWRTNAKFIEFYKNELIKQDYLAFYWEHPALQNDFLEKKYECILQRSKPLEHLATNEEAFKEYIYSETKVIDFMNLGKNTRLIIPTKRSKDEIYNHFGKFLRHADDGQILALFKRLGKVIISEIEEQKVIWLNTAGLGVIWLHIRMDTKPKYYKTKKYKEPDFLESIS